MTLISNIDALLVESEAVIRVKEFQMNQTNQSIDQSNEQSINQSISRLYSD